MIQEIGLFLIVFHSVLSTSTKWGNSCWISSIQITEFFGQLPPLGWRTVWVRQGFSFLIVKFCLGNSDSISCFIASSTVNLPMVALPRCCCSAVQSIFALIRRQMSLLNHLADFEVVFSWLSFLILCPMNDFTSLKNCSVHRSQVSFIFKEGSKTCCQFSKMNASTTTHNKQKEFLWQGRFST